MTDATVLLHHSTGATYDDLYRLAPVDMWARVEALEASLTAFREASEDIVEGDSAPMPQSI